MKTNDFIYLIVGKSGSGKTTLAKALCEKFGWSEIQSYTTRPPRYLGETGHIFVTDEEFDKLTDYVAYTEFDGNRYCATAQQVEENEVYVVDPAGVRYFAEHYNGNKTVKVIYLTIKTRALFKRMMQRGDKLHKIIKRLWHDYNIFERDFNNHPVWLFLDCSDKIAHLALLGEHTIEESIKMIEEESYMTYSITKEGDFGEIFSKENTDER